VYGPAECTVDATACRVSSEFEQPSIGRPIANVQIYILDAALRVSATGMAGELCIGGAGVGRGYIGAPDLTAEKFTPHPYGKEPGERLYRTGDLGRFIQGGAIEYLGRIDYQVKIRGARVEPGEIEAALLRNEAVRECAVIACADATKAKPLAAYVVLRSGQSSSVSELRAHILSLLPEYMVPSAFVFLDRLPLTRNGKVDRVALSLSEEERQGISKAILLPRTAIEDMLEDIWRQLLKLDRISVDDNFFELGGHSILAAQVISQIRKTLNVETPLRSMFEQPTIAGLSALIGQMIEGDKSDRLPLIKRVDRDGDLPLSFAQQRLWFLKELDPDSTAYNIPGAFHLVGSLDVMALEQAFAEIIRRHEVLRTVFKNVRGLPLQIVLPPPDFKLRTVDLSILDEEARDYERRRLASAEAKALFDFAEGPLLRTLLIRLGATHHLLLLTLHHIIFDAWSIGVLAREIGVLYQSFTAGLHSPLTELPIQYADYAHWQRQWLQGEVLENQLTYWKGRLKGLPYLDLPTDRPRPPVQTTNGRHLVWGLPAGLQAQLRTLCRQSGATLFMATLAAFKVLLCRHARQTDIGVGTPVANRRISEIENLIGFFINTLVLRTDLSGDPTFRQLLERVKEGALSAYAHQDLPFELLVENLQPEREMSHTPLFQVMFGMQNAAQDVSLDASGVKISPRATESGTARFDMIFLIADRNEELKTWVEYNTDIFSGAFIERLLRRWESLLVDICANPNAPISHLSLLSQSERHQLVSEWNASVSRYPERATIQQLFELQVERRPQSEALVFEDQQLSYRELSMRSNQLARSLRQVGVGTEKLVGICLERSIEMAIAVLGVLKAGGAYVPIDPAYPRERRSYMIEDSRISVLLTQSWLAADFDGCHSEIICLDTDWPNVASEDVAPLPDSATIDNLVYVTYTSGSTGRPKGIAMQQRPLLNLLNWQLQTTDLPPGARTLQFASLSFDVSFQDLFSTWLSGGSVVMISGADRRDISGLANIIHEKRIDRLFIPAVALQQLAENMCSQPGISNSLQRVIAGSEQLQITHSIMRMFRELKNCSLFNEYGPSETHVVTAFNMASDTTQWPDRPPVGRPIFNTQIYLLDERMEPVPIGIPGELFIGGVSLARGYLHRPDLTAERFIPDPFIDQPGGRLYRTGDLARYLPNGNLEFLGRIDLQVKVRGYRIEPGEIEAALSQHPSVRENVVIVREDIPGDKRLVAYVIVGSDEAPTFGDLRSFLQEKLPDYMIPSHFVMLESFPLNANGKIDRRALPTPDHARPELDKVYMAPRNATEEVLVSIWSKVLGCSGVGVCDNFFDLGGHSLLATQLISRVRETFLLDIPLKYLFESPTVAGFAQRMESFETQSGTIELAASLILNLEQLSEDEAQALLDEELSVAK